MNLTRGILPAIRTVALRTAGLALIWAAAPMLDARAQDLRSIPPLSGPVIDEAGILPRNQMAALESELQSYPPKMQLQIWILNSLNGEPIESLSIRAAEQWKLGTAKDDRGALILVAIGDRKMRIEVGQGLEGEIPDVSAGRMVRQILTPAFRSGDYYGGLLAVSRTMYSAAGGEPAGDVPATQGSRRVRRGGLTDVAIAILAIFFILFSLVGSLFGRRRRGFWGGFGGGGGGWSGGGGGSSWSGGGGGFSGGGSSGNW